ncbi:S-layer homology domain-containing protein [Paenibacillus sp. sgz500958]|uniref:S-layer homology domain-containing protein n=1 Tax=Paenibacillus sp. sgz500958 TaxID=3242475 RepID=UPI0036D2D076
MNKHNVINRAKKITIACSILAASVSFGASAFAFSDLKGNPAEGKINALHSNGVINGVTSNKFAPKSSVTFAQGVQFIVSGLQLKANAAPGTPSKASDYFDKVSDKSWYARAFVIAEQNGLSIDKNVNPNSVMTRAQFAHLMTQALLSKGEFAVTKMYVNVADGDKLSGEVMNSLQILLNTHLITLDAGGKFRPNDPVTRAEAAVWIYDAAQFAKKVITPNQQPQPQTPVYEQAVVSVVKAAEGVNKVTLTVDNLPNPGYGLAIDKIEFGKDKTAVIYYRVTTPDPDKMVAQVISKASVVTYLPEGYTATAKIVASGSSSSASSK